VKVEFGFVFNIRNCSEMFLFFQLYEGSLARFFRPFYDYFTFISFLETSFRLFDRGSEIRMYVSYDVTIAS